ncbi:MAG: winged helix-turn-helix domain-containing protein [Halothiobacillus sp. 24-54-40]|jgi:DNA-binding Lrp family transcriptional regulator|nr:MAG: winged helix-turn-helix domain-containing protein [Halothiobacillus sp. 20-53-49]OYZ87118.1 MAG: winged helix-turn-helix domain-containing protein [Halothiobacillus sp. 24-54-40]OZA80723.1 MAG: winged helix-turn-helix domain-containing protein [Halothiobacillus sp. 39-53-45]HQS03288.1 Lrp/AsnC family transcriptional regulator [Halothiobacillus sp.]HQT37976.1 Lrp/AsnC family transcriptional regulator [Acidocella sp.]
MNNLDQKILTLLVDNGRLSFADIARELDISRVHARDRVLNLVEEGVIEKFTVIVNPEKIGTVVSAFLDVEVDPQGIETVAADLARQPEVVSLYIMSDMTSLHIHTLTEDNIGLESFVRRNLFSRQHVVKISCKLLLSRVKNRRGGPRI